MTTPPGTSDTAGAPGVGNVLGLSLLLRRRKALLALEARTVTPGVRISDYEADLSNVEFPLRPPLSPARFRHHRCVVRRVTLSMQARAIRKWLQRSVEGRTFGPLTVDRVELALSGQLTPSGPVTPCLLLHGRATGRRALALFALQARAAGRRVAVSVSTAWGLGFGMADTAEIWSAISKALDPGASEAVTLDPVRTAVSRTFVRAGWKAPDLGELQITTIDVTAGLVQITLGERGDEAAALPPPGVGPDPIRVTIEQIHAQFAEGDRAEATARLSALADAVVHHDAARVAVLRWLAAAAGPKDPTTSCAALKTWLHLTPRDETAHRMLLGRLWTSGRIRDVAQRLAAACRLPNAPDRQARLELALACVFVDHLGDLEAGRALLEPLVGRVGNGGDPLLRLDVLAAMARAQADKPTAARQALAEALRHTQRPAVTASIRAGVGNALARAGHPAVALDLLRVALTEAPDDADSFDLALELAQRTQDVAALGELVDHAAAHASHHPDIGGLRRRVLAWTAGRTGDEADHLTARVLEAALASEPNAHDLLARLAELQDRRGDAEAAATVLARLSEQATDPRERAALVLRRVRLLEESGDTEGAWDSLRTILDDVDPRLEPEVLVTGLGLAPVASREEIVDRLVAIDAGDRGGRALLERAAATSSSHQRHRDLSRAAELLDDPRPALQKLAELAPPEDRRAWARLADAHAEAGDTAAEVTARTELALRCLAARELPQAAAALTAALRRRPERAAAVLLGLVLARGGDYVAAGELLAPWASEPLPPLDHGLLADPRADVDPRAGAVEHEIATALEQSGDDEAALSLLRRAIDGVIDPPLARAMKTRIARLAERLGDPGLARALADVAEASSPDDAAPWFLRAAEHGTPVEARTWIDAARQVAPGSERVIAAAEALARTEGDLVGLERALAQRVELASGSRRAAILRELMHVRVGQSGRRASSTLDAATQLLRIEPGDAEAAALLAADFDRRGEPARAESHWAIAFDGLADDDPRLPDLAVRLARRARSTGDLDEAMRLLERARRVTPTAPVFTALRELADARADAQLRLVAAQGLRAVATTDADRARAELDIAQLTATAGDPRAALDRLVAAGGWARDAAPLRTEIAEARLQLCLQYELGPEAELAARAELRAAAGNDVSAASLGDELKLMARLGRHAEAIEVIADGLRDNPADPLLLSELKVHALATDDPSTYVAAVERALDGHLPPDLRDRLSLELAMAAAELGDAPRALHALEHGAHTLADSPEALDVWDWAVVALGQEAEQLHRLDERLIASRADASTLVRLRRRLDDPHSFVEHLLALAGRREGPATDLLAAALDDTLALADNSLLLRTVRISLGHGATDLVADRWADIEDRTVRSGDDAAIADLVQLTDDAGNAELRQRGSELLDVALAWIPQAASLHRALWARLRGDPDDVGSGRAALAHVTELADAHELTADDRARLVVGVARQLPRRACAELLVEHAKARLQQPDAFAILVGALEGDGHWPEALMLHEARVDVADDEDNVAIHKHLAHIASDTLGDPAAAIHHLETALELAPTDPDLLLPLLDHHFARKDLRRAVELSRLVLESISMGQAAFAALAHRAADAAVAGDDPDVAIELMTLCAQRVPTDTRATARIEELERIADDPAKRVLMLANVADRQSGTARWRALEERARLLLDPLGRLDEAIAALEAVVEEAPGRTETGELLAELYQRSARWLPLIDLLEAALVRRHGVDKADTLRRIAGIQRDALGDVAAAEQAVRAAMEHVAAEDDPARWDGLSQELADDLLSQQRWPDFVAHAMRWLAEDLDADAKAPTTPIKIEYLTRLAEIHRDELDDQSGAAAVYERLLALGSIPDDGLASLARWYHHERRHRELVGVLSMRAEALVGEAQAERRAAVQLRIAELLEGPLGRPHEAAPHYLEAYLADPETQTAAGTRARVLLSGTDSVANVRHRLRERAAGLPTSRRPALLTLLGDLLAPQDGYEEEAEAYYRKALDIDEGTAAASEGLGRLLIRLGRPREAAQALLDAARSEVVPATRAAECAAAAARQFLEIDDAEAAQRAVKLGLRRRPGSQRAMLELARVHERTGRTREQKQVLDQLSQSPLPIALQAEVAFRRAMLLSDSFGDNPRGPAGERARALLLEAVGADATHTAARQALVELATARQEWSIVAHMQFLTVRELPVGPARARANLDLAVTYLDRLSDADSALRHIVTALQQAPDDSAITSRVAQLMARMPDRTAAAEQLEKFASEIAELGESARARLWLLAADLRMPDEDEPVSLESVHDGEPTEDRQRAEAVAKLDSIDGTATAEVLEALAAGQRHVAPGDDEVARRRLAAAFGRVAEAHDADTTPSLRRVLAQHPTQGAGLYPTLATLAETLRAPGLAADTWRLAGELAWQVDGAYGAAAAALRTAAELSKTPRVLEAIDALVAASVEHDQSGDVWRELKDMPTESPRSRLSRAQLALAVGEHDAAAALATPLTALGQDTQLRFVALGVIDAVLARRGESHARVEGLSARLDLALAREDPAIGDIATELAQLLSGLGQPTAALRAANEAAAHAPRHRGLLRIRAQLLDSLEAHEPLLVAYDQLAEVARDEDERAMWLTKIADVLVRHPEVAGPAGTQRATDLLRRACELAPRRPAPRVALMPLLLTAARYDELEQTASELLALGEHHDVLVLAALGQAYRMGRRDLATRLGLKAQSGTAADWLIRGIDHVLEQVARGGPLPRLDDVLGAAATLAGGRGPLLDALKEHGGSRRARAGINLALARLNESRGAATAARHHYQLAAFLAPQGPVPPLVNRLPSAPLAERIDQAGAAPMEGRQPLRLALMQLASRMVGLEPRPGPEAAAPGRQMAAVVERAEALVAPWRARLRVDLQVGWADAPDLFGVGVRNASPPAIVLTPASLELDDAELTFRLAEAAATIVMGLGVLASGTFEPGDLLEAVRYIANPMLRPSRPGGQHLADAFAEREASLRDCTLEERANLVQECTHWLSTADGPKRWRLELLRSRRLFGARLSGRLDGALRAIAREHVAQGATALRPRQLLSRPDVQWLVRSLGLR